MLAEKIHVVLAVAKALSIINPLAQAIAASLHYSVAQLLGQDTRPSPATAASPCRWNLAKSSIQSRSRRPLKPSGRGGEFQSV